MFYNTHILQLAFSSSTEVSFSFDNVSVYFSHQRDYENVYINIDLKSIHDFQTLLVQFDGDHSRGSHVLHFQKLKRTSD